jgi:hypothetical protein
MKKSQLRQIIKETIRETLNEQPLGGYQCMNTNPPSPTTGYCVLQMSQQSVWETMQNQYGFGVWGIYPTLEACIASPECNEEYTHNAYPPPQGGVNPNIGQKPGTGSEFQNYAPNQNKRAVAPQKRNRIKRRRR